MRRIKTSILAVLACMFIMLCAVPAFAGELFPFSVSSKARIYTYTVRSGDTDIFEDAEMTVKKETVKGSDLYAAILKAEGSAFYAKYKCNDKTDHGWFAMKTFVYTPSREFKDCCARSTAPVAKKYKGESFGTIPAFSRMQVVGEYKTYKQVIYEYKGKYRIGWMTNTDFDKYIKYYDASEKQIMADGTYTLKPRSAFDKMVTVSGTNVGLAAAKKVKRQRFNFEYCGGGWYRITSVYNGMCLAHDSKLGASGVGLVPKTETPEKSQLWKPERYNKYYYIKNAETEKYLYADEEFSLAPRGASDNKRFRITMYGGKNKDHWRVFCQYEPEWGGKLYGKTNNMAASACGILSLTNTIYALNGQYIDPTITAAFSVKNKYRVEGSGTSYKLFAAASKQFGKQYGFEYVGATTNFNTLSRHLQKGETAIAYVPGHYIACVDYKAGKYLLLESAYVKKRATTPYGDWVLPSRLKSGALKSKNFFIFKAID